MANLELRQENPPAKLHTENRGSKYDVAINTALENTGTWYRVASTTVENRDSMYSTASALRGGRLETSLPIKLSRLWSDVLTMKSYFLLRDYNMIKEIAKLLWSWTEYPEKAPKRKR